MKPVLIFITLLTISVIFPAHTSGEYPIGRSSLSRKSSISEIDAFIDRLTKLESEGKTMPEGQVIEILMHDLNSYLNHTARTEPGEIKVQNIKISFTGKNTFSAYTEVFYDIGSLFKKGKPVSTDKKNKKAFGFKNRIRVSARLSSAKGRGIVIINSLRINGIKLSIKMAYKLLKAIGARQKPPFDPTRLTRLPYNIKSVKILNNRLRIFF